MKTTKQTTLTIKRDLETISIDNNLGFNFKFPLEGADMFVATSISYTVLQYFQNSSSRTRNLKMTLQIEEL